MRTETELEQALNRLKAKIATEGVASTASAIAVVMMTAEMLALDWVMGRNPLLDEEAQTIVEEK